MLNGILKNILYQIFAQSTKYWLVGSKNNFNIMFVLRVELTCPDSVLVPGLNSWGNEPSDNAIYIFQLISKKLRPYKLNSFHK